MAIDFARLSSRLGPVKYFSARLWFRIARLRQKYAPPASS